MASASTESVRARRRIVLAAICVEDEAIDEVFGRDPDSDSTKEQPTGLASMELRFRRRLPWWSSTSTIGTGATPRGHGVLTAMAIDHDGRGVHARRESDSDRPWIWQRFDHAGLDACVCGWPILQDLSDPGVPGATTAALMTPKRMLEAVERGDDATLATMLRPADRSLAKELVQSMHAARADLDGDPDTRVAAMVCAASARLGLWTSEHNGHREGPLLCCLGMQLRSRSPIEPDDAGLAGNDRDSHAEGREARQVLQGRRLASALNRLSRDLGPDDVLLAAAIGPVRARLSHRGIEVAKPFARLVDLVPTALLAAEIPVTADLPGAPLQQRTPTSPRNWDLSGWNSADRDVGARIDAISVAERAQRAFRRIVGSSDDDESATMLRDVLIRHFELQSSLAIDFAEWPDAIVATERLLELRDTPIDLWRRAFAAERGGDAAVRGEAINRLRREHPDTLAASLTPLLEDGPPSKELIESIDLTAIASPCQLSVVGRAAERLGLDDVARPALAKLVYRGLALPADRIALSNVLLRCGRADLAILTMGDLGSTPSSRPGIRVHRAKCLAAAGRRQEAIEALDQLLLELPFEGAARTLREQLVRSS